MREFVDEHGLALHLDGARLFNAVVASGEPVAASRPPSTASPSALQGAGAPVGSRWWAPMPSSRGPGGCARCWGGMRQEDPAQAALFALDQRVPAGGRSPPRQAPGAGLAALPGIELSGGEVQTNMVFLRLAKGGECRAARLHEGARHPLLRLRGTQAGHPPADH